MEEQPLTRASSEDAKEVLDVEPFVTVDATVASDVTQQVVNKALASSDDTDHESGEGTSQPPWKADSKSPPKSPPKSPTKRLHTFRRECFARSMQMRSKDNDWLEQKSGRWAVAIDAARVRNEDEHRLREPISNPQTVSDMRRAFYYGLRTQAVPYGIKPNGLMWKYTLVVDLGDDNHWILHSDQSSSLITALINVPHEIEDCSTFEERLVTLMDEYETLRALCEKDASYGLFLFYAQARNAPCMTRHFDLRVIRREKRETPSIKSPSASTNSEDPFILDMGVRVITSLNKDLLLSDVQSETFRRTRLSSLSPSEASMPQTVEAAFYNRMFKEYCCVVIDDLQGTSGLTELTAGLSVQASRNNGLANESLPERPDTPTDEQSSQASSPRSHASGTAAISCPKCRISKTIVDAERRACNKKVSQVQTELYNTCAEMHRNETRLQNEVNSKKILISNNAILLAETTKTYEEEKTRNLARIKELEEYEKHAKVRISELELEFMLLAPEPSKKKGRKQSKTESKSTSHAKSSSPEKQVDTIDADDFAALNEEMQTIKAENASLRGALEKAEQAVKTQQKAHSADLASAQEIQAQLQADLSKQCAEIAQAKAEIERCKTSQQRSKQTLEKNKTTIDTLRQGEAVLRKQLTQMKTEKARLVSRVSVAERTVRKSTSLDMSTTSAPSTQSTPLESPKKALETEDADTKSSEAIESAGSTHEGGEPFQPESPHTSHEIEDVSTSNPAKEKRHLAHSSVHPPSSIVSTNNVSISVTHTALPSASSSMQVQEESPSYSTSANTCGVSQMTLSKRGHKGGGNSSANGAMHWQQRNAVPHPRVRHNQMAATNMYVPCQTPIPPIASNGYPEVYGYYDANGAPVYLQPYSPVGGPMGIPMADVNAWTSHAAPMGMMDDRYYRLASAMVGSGGDPTQIQATMSMLSRLRTTTNGHSQARTDLESLLG